MPRYLQHAVRRVASIERPCSDKKFIAFIATNKKYNDASANIAAIVTCAVCNSFNKVIAATKIS